MLIIVCLWIFDFYLLLELQFDGLCQIYYLILQILLKLRIYEDFHFDLNS